MPENESKLSRRSAPNLHESDTERRKLRAVKVHVTPKGGRSVNPDDLFESPFLNSILGLDDPEPQSASDTHDHKLTP